MNPLPSGPPSAQELVWPMITRSLVEIAVTLLTGVFVSIVGIFSAVMLVQEFIVRSSPDALWYFLWMLAPMVTVGVLAGLSCYAARYHLLRSVSLSAMLTTGFFLASNLPHYAISAALLNVPACLFLGAAVSYLTVALTSLRSRPSSASLSGASKASRPGTMR